MIPFTKNAVAQRRRLWPARPSTTLTTSGRVVPDSEELFRFAWVLVYRDGSSLFQYSQTGDVLIQESFADAKKTNVKDVLIFDLQASIEKPVAVLHVPDNAEVDILYNNRIVLHSTTISGTRVYTFGWHVPGTETREYFHFDPTRVPVVVTRNHKRVL